MCLITLQCLVINSGVLILISLYGYLPLELNRSSNIVNREYLMVQWVSGRSPAELLIIRYEGLYEVTEREFSSVQSLSRVRLFATPWTRPPCPSLTPGVHPNIHPLSQWCHPTVSSSVVPFSSRLQSFPASGSSMSQFFASGGQSIGVSASASVLPMNIQDWFPLGWTGWISFQSKGLSIVFSNTTVQTHQFFGAQLSLGSKPHIHTWLLEKP